VQNPKDNEITTWPPEAIEGVQIRLRCISLTDAPAIANLMTPDISEWLASWPANPTVEAVRERIIRAEKAMQQKRELHFRIEECERNVTVGYVSVARSATDSGVGHISYWLGNAFQGKGYMTEAVRHAINAAFRYMDLERVEAGAQPENLSSFSVMRRVGMSPIGERVVWANNRQRNEKCLFYSVDRATFNSV